MFACYKINIWTDNFHRAAERRWNVHEIYSGWKFKPPVQLSAHRHRPHCYIYVSAFSDSCCWTGDGGQALEVEDLCGTEGAASDRTSGLRAAGTGRGPGSGELQPHRLASCSGAAGPSVVRVLCRAGGPPSLCASFRSFPHRVLFL